MNLLNSEDKDLTEVKRLAAAVMKGLNHALDLSDPSKSMAAYFALILSAASLLGIFASSEEIEAMSNETLDLLKNTALLAKKVMSNPCLLYTSPSPRD